MEMFVNYKEMSADEKAQVKAIHKAIRAEASHRTGNLAWGFIRGFPYRRIERTTRTQVMSDGTIVEHNKPSALGITRLLGKFIPEFATQTKHPAIVEWLANQEGAIPAPVREKKPYVRPTVSGAA